MKQTETFPRRLRRLREQRRLSRATLGELCGLSKTAVSRYERGEREPSMTALVAMADYFGVAVDYLIGRRDAP